MKFSGVLSLMHRYSEEYGVSRWLSATVFFLTDNTSSSINPLVKCVQHQSFREKDPPRRIKYG